MSVFFVIMSIAIKASPTPRPRMPHSKLICKSLYNLHLIEIIRLKLFLLLDQAITQTLEMSVLIFLQNVLQCCQPNWDGHHLASSRDVSEFASNTSPSHLNAQVPMITEDADLTSSLNMIGSCSKWQLCWSRFGKDKPGLAGG